MQKKRIVNLSAVPSRVTWIIKNHILNSLLCLTSDKILTGLNTVWSQNIKPILLGTHKNLSHDPLTPTIHVHISYVDKRMQNTTHTQSTVCSLQEQQLLLHTSSGCLTKHLPLPTQWQFINPHAQVVDTSSHEPRRGRTALTQKNTEVLGGSYSLVQSNCILKCLPDEQNKNQHWWVPGCLLQIFHPSRPEPVEWFCNGIPAGNCWNPNHPLACGRKTALPLTSLSSDILYWEHSYWRHTEVSHIMLTDTEIQLYPAFLVFCKYLQAEDSFLTKIPPNHHKQYC